MLDRYCSLDWFGGCKILQINNEHSFCTSGSALKICKIHEVSFYATSSLPVTAEWLWTNGSFKNFRAQQKGVIKLYYRKFKSEITQNSCQLGFIVVISKLERLIFVLATPQLGKRIMLCVAVKYAWVLSSQVDLITFYSRAEIVTYLCQATIYSVPWIPKIYFLQNKTWIETFPPNFFSYFFSSTR